MFSPVYVVFWLFWFALSFHQTTYKMLQNYPIIINKHLCIGHTKIIPFLQGNVGSSAATPNPTSLDTLVYNGTGITEQARDVSGMKYTELSPERVASGPGESTEIPLCQRLLAALISEDGVEDPCSSGSEELDFNIYGSECELDGGIESGAFNNHSLQSFEISGRTSFSGYRITASGRSYSELEHNQTDKDLWKKSGIDYSQNGFLPDQAVTPVLSSSDIQYNNMSINERALMEIQSIGLFPEPVVCTLF